MALRSQRNCCVQSDIGQNTSDWLPAPGTARWKCNHAQPLRYEIEHRPEIEVLRLPEPLLRYRAARCARTDGHRQTPHVARSMRV
jgi:hypothetical protein